MEEIRTGLRLLTASYQTLLNRVDSLTANIQTFNETNTNILRDVAGLSGEIRQAFLQSDENNLKRLYNSAHCTNHKLLGLE